MRAALPEDLPHAVRLVEVAARHLERVEETNRHFNLTRIVSARDAAVKHVLDSVLPWKLFAGDGTVIDAGTGAGFPGIPLAVVLPETRVVLAESVGKKARFVQECVEALGLANVTVEARRAEEVLRDMREGLVAARAVAPIDRAVTLFAPALRRGMRALLYKGPDAEAEIAQAAAALRRSRVEARVVLRYELPDGLGGRAMVELRAAPRK